MVSVKASCQERLSEFKATQKNPRKKGRAEGK
jgi:hypothetical protein